MVEDHPIQTANRSSCRRPGFVRRRRVVRWICLAPMVAFSVLIGGFLWFALHIANEESPLGRAADGIVALTGGASRITDAVELLATGRGRRLLITGVGPTTNAAELMRLAPDHQRWFGCCIDLDYSAANTVGNAMETRRWARERGFRSLVVVTSGYHMPRAMVELEAAAPGVRVTPYPVATTDLDARRWLDDRRGAERMAKEYCKYLVALTRASLPGPRATGQV